MYCALPEHIYMPPAAELSISNYIPIADGVVDFVSYLVHGMLLQVIWLVVNVELVSVSEGDMFEFTCIFTSLLVVS